MGSTLSSPSFEKDCGAVESESLVCAYGSSRAWRDQYTGKFFFDLDFDDDGAKLFGVFDGHGGNEIAKYAAHRMPHLIKTKYHETHAYETALKYAFYEIDKCLLHLDSQVRTLGLEEVPDENFKDEEPYGKKDFKELLHAVASKSASAIVVILTSTNVFIGNVGRGKCVAAEGERASILANGNSNTLGACKNKRNLPENAQKEAVQPEIMIMTYKPGLHKFMVVACDGIWASINSQAAVDFVHGQMKLPDNPLANICDELITKCLSPSYFSHTGKDNMTLLIVKFNQGITKSLPMEIVDRRDREERERRPSARDLMLMMMRK